MKFVFSSLAIAILLIFFLIMNFMTSKIES